MCECVSLHQRMVVFQLPSQPQYILETRYRPISRDSYRNDHGAHIMIFIAHIQVVRILSVLIGSLPGP